MAWCDTNEGIQTLISLFQIKSLHNLSLDDWQQLEDLHFPCSSIITHYGERSTAAPMHVEKCSHETTAGPGGL
eukprot:5810285-Prorocentrum_lima.AAC.1